MITITFEGHRSIYDWGIKSKIEKVLDDLMKMDNEFIFYVGESGDFDKFSTGAVKTAKIKYPEIKIKLILVLPYMSNKINKYSDFYQK